MDSSDLVAQFCSITESDPETAEQYLALADRNLETAITLFIEGGSVPITDQEYSTSAASRLSPGAATGGGDLTDISDDAALSRRLQQEEYANNSSDNVREAIKPVTETLVESSYGGLHRLPFDLLNQFAPTPGIRRSRNTFEENDLEDEADQLTDLDEYGSRSRRRVFKEDPEDESDPDIDVIAGLPSMSSSQSLLDRQFRPPLDITCNYNLDMAKDLARVKEKWIIVNVQDVQEFRCHILNRDLWSDKRVKSMIKKNFIFLQYNNDSHNGVEFKSFYPFTSFPYIGILDPRTGEQLKKWDHNPTPTEFLEDVEKFLKSFSLNPKHKNPLVRIPKEKKDPASMSEEDQIAFAVRQSLGKDEESDVQDSDDDIEIIKELPSDSKGKTVTIDIASEIVGEEEGEEEEEEVDNDEEGEEKDPSLDEPTEEDIVDSIIADDEVEPELGKEGITRIQFRLSDGSRIVRRFNTSDLVRKLFGFVKARVESTHNKYFSLTSERKKLISMLDQTIEEANLKNSSILVEVLE